MHEKLKTVLPAVILKKKSWPPTSQNFKSHKTFFVQRFLLHTYTTIPKLYSIFLLRYLKTKKVRHPHPHPHPNKSHRFFFISENGVQNLVLYQWWPFDFQNISVVTFISDFTSLKIYQFSNVSAFYFTKYYQWSQYQHSICKILLV